MEIEKKISVRDLFKSVLLKWRIIVAFMFLGAVALGGISLVRNYKVVADKPLSEDEPPENVIEKFRNALTLQEAGEVESAISVYRIYSRKYETVKTYNDHSLYMKIDSTCVPTLQLDYYIKDVDSNEVSTDMENMRLNDIREAYQNKLQNADLYNELLPEFGDDIKSSYITELITFSDTSLDTGSGNVSINVIADTKENCDMLAEYVMNAVNEITLDLQAVFGDFELIPYNSSYSEQVNQTVATTQKSQIDLVYSLRGTVNVLTSTFTDEQYSYYDALLTAIDPEKELLEEQSAETETRETEAVVTSSNRSLLQVISKKYVLLGAILGILCACFWYMLKYILNNDLHISDDIREYYQVSVLGNVKESVSRKGIFSGIDKGIYALFDEKWDASKNEIQLGLICEKIKIFMRKNNLKNIYISGADMSYYAVQIAGQITEMLKSEVVVIGVGAICSDSDALKQMSCSDAVVLIETIGKSSYVDIQREVEQCQINNISIIGCVVLH